MLTFFYRLFIAATISVGCGGQQNAPSERPRDTQTSVATNSSLQHEPMAELPRCRRSSRRDYDQDVQRCLESEEQSQDSYAYVTEYGSLAWMTREPNEYLIHLRRRRCVHTVIVNSSQGRYENGEYSWASCWQYAPSTGRLTYSAFSPEGVVVVTDGVEGSPFCRSGGGPRFSKNGQHIMYVSMTRSRLPLSRQGRVIVIDGEVRGNLDGMRDDGVVGLTSAGRWILGVRDEDLAVYVNGNLVSRCDLDERFSNSTDVGLVTSQEGDRYAFRCNRGQEQVLLLDGREIAPPPGWRISEIDFSPNGLHWWYIAESRETPASAIVFDGELILLRGSPHATFRLVRLSENLFAAVINEVSGQESVTAQLIGPFQCQGSTHTNLGAAYSIVANGSVCYRQQQPLDLGLFERLQDGTVTYAGQPVAR